MLYHGTSSGVFTSLFGWETWLTTMVKKRHEWLLSKNCCGCYVSLDLLPKPDSFPVLTSVNWDGSWGCQLTFIYPNQIRELLGLGTKLEEHNEGPTAEVNNLMEDREI